jgi:hypothetical protein
MTPEAFHIYLGLAEAFALENEPELRSVSPDERRERLLWAFERLRGPLPPETLIERPDVPDAFRGW